MSFQDQFGYAFDIPQASAGNASPLPVLNGDTFGLGVPVQWDQHQQDTLTAAQQGWNTPGAGIIAATPSPTSIPLPPSDPRNGGSNLPYGFGTPGFAATQIGQVADSIFGTNDWSGQNSQNSAATLGLPGATGTATSTWALIRDIFLRGTVIILGFIFVAVGLSMFKSGGSIDPRIPLRKVVP